jgi:uncharacterized membrane protein YjjB (DUF3815 family)
MPTLLLQALYSFVATLGFAVLYNVPRRALLLCGLIGMTGHLIRSLVQQMGLSSTISIFVGATAVGLIAVLPANRLQLPVILFTITGIISMIPGIPAFKVLVYFNQGDLIGGLQSAIQAGFGVGAIAIGIGTARILTEHDWWFDRD